MVESLKVADDGSLFIIVNCSFDGIRWQRTDTTKTTELLMVDINGKLKRFRASAGDNPITSWDLLNGVVISDTSGSLPDITKITTRNHNDLQNRDAVACHPPEAVGVLSQSSNTILTPTKQTTSVFDKYDPQLQVAGNTIYYTWNEYDGATYQIWTATSNLDGSGFTATKQTTSAYYNEYPQLQVVGNTIYYIWYELDGAKRQIWTATSNLDGSGFTATKQTTSDFDKRYPQLQVVGNTIYYTWHEYDGAKQQLWTATSNLDGSGFTATKQTTSVFDKYYPQLQVAGNTIYYTWQEYDGAKRQIWTATSNTVKISSYFPRRRLDVTGFRVLNITYTNTDPTRTLHVQATVRCATTVAGGNAYVQGKAEISAGDPTAFASGIVGIQTGLLNENNSSQIDFYVMPGEKYRIDSSATNGTVTLGNWFETYI